MAGLLTRPNYRAFPVSTPVAGCGNLEGTYSSGYCSGFSPDSLFILNEIIFSGTITFAKINLFFMFYLFCRLFNALIFHFFD